MAERNYKREYKKFHASAGAINKRAKLNKINREKGTYGNGDNKDWSHQKDGGVILESSSVNKGHNNNSQGDRNARGKGSIRAKSGAKITVNKKTDGLTVKQKENLKKHSKHHSKKHMNMMIKLMKQGKTFTQAHNEAMNKVGK